MTWECSTWHFCLHWAPCGRLSPLWRCPWCHPARPVPTSTTSALRNHRVAGVLCRWVATERSLHATPLNSILQSDLDSWDIYRYIYIYTLKKVQSYIHSCGLLQEVQIEIHIRKYKNSSKCNTQCNIYRCYYTGIYQHDFFSKGRLPDWRSVRKLALKVMHC